MSRNILSFLGKRGSGNVEHKTVHQCAINNDIEGIKAILKKDKNSIFAQDPITGQTGERQGTHHNQKHTN